MKESKPKASAEAILDAAVELTFPASDPVSVDHAFMIASRRERNILGTREPDTSNKATRSTPSRKKIKRAASAAGSK